MVVLLARVCGSIATGVVHWATFCVAAPVSAGDGEAELAWPGPSLWRPAVRVDDGERAGHAGDTQDDHRGHPGQHPGPARPPVTQLLQRAAGQHRAGLGGRPIVVPAAASRLVVLDDVIRLAGVIRPARVAGVAAAGRRGLYRRGGRRAEHGRETVPGGPRGFAGRRPRPGMIRAGNPECRCRRPARRCIRRTTRWRSPQRIRSPASRRIAGQRTWLSPPGHRTSRSTQNPGNWHAR